MIPRVQPTKTSITRPNIGRPPEFGQQPQSFINNRFGPNCTVSVEVNIFQPHQNQNQRHFEGYAGYSGYCNNSNYVHHQKTSEPQASYQNDQCALTGHEKTQYLEKAVPNLPVFNPDDIDEFISSELLPIDQDESQNMYHGSSPAGYPSCQAFCRESSENAQNDFTIQTDSNLSITEENVQPQTIYNNITTEKKTIQKPTEKPTKRGRPPLGRSEEEKTLRRREKNRDAATRSRQKKEEHKTRLEKENAMLRQLIQDKDEESIFLRDEKNKLCNEKNKQLKEVIGMLGTVGDSLLAMHLHNMPEVLTSETFKDVIEGMQRIRKKYESEIVTPMDYEDDSCSEMSD